MPFALRSLRTALAAVCLLTVSACTGSSAGPSAVTFPPTNRKAAPNVSGVLLESGAQYSLAQQRGHVVVINYWASWCVPCREEAPQLNDAYKDFTPQGVRFVGVSFHGDAKDLAKGFLQAQQVPYDSLFDASSKTVLQFRGKVAIAAPPLTMVIDKQGRIADVINGVVTFSVLRDMITAANAESA